jgi:hypothetical protein
MAFGWDRINKMTREMKERDIAEGRYYLPGLVATGAEGEEIKALTAEVEKYRKALESVANSGAATTAGWLIMDDVMDKVSRVLGRGQG